MTMQHSIFCAIAVLGMWLFAPALLSPKGPQEHDRIMSMQQTALLARLDKDDSIFRQEQIDCLAQNIYFEARGESQRGQMAVAQVTINRVKSKEFSGTICHVVHEKHYVLGSWHCQFSWVCNKKVKQEAIDQNAYKVALEIATKAYDGYLVANTVPNVVSTATFYHTHKVNHFVGGKRAIIIANIDNHVFYKVASI